MIADDRVQPIPPELDEERRRGQVQGGTVRTIKQLGVIDPDEQIIPTAQLARA